MKIDTLIKRGRIVPAYKFHHSTNFDSSVAIMAKVLLTNDNEIADTDDLQAHTAYKVPLWNLEFVGVTPVEIIVKAECEYGEVYQSYNLAMFHALFDSDSRDHFLTQHILWTKDPVIRLT